MHPPTSIANLLRGETRNYDDDMMTKKLNAGVKNDLNEMIRRYRWYQRIPLGSGLYTPGETKDTSDKLELIDLPDDLSGKSLLEIGCSEGFFSFEAERRHARRILSIDKSKSANEKFEIL